MENTIKTNAALAGAAINITRMNGNLVAAAISLLAATSLMAGSLTTTSNGSAYVTVSVQSLDPYTHLASLPRRCLLSFAFCPVR